MCWFIREIYLVYFTFLVVLLVVFCIMVDCGTIHVVLELSGMQHCFSLLGSSCLVEVVVVVVVFSIKKVAHTRLPSVGFRSQCQFLAVSLQVT